MKLKTTIEFFKDMQAHIREMDFSDANEAADLNLLSEGYIADAIEALEKEEEYKKRITELVKLIETFAQEIREKHVDTDFCGLCEYDADFSIGESGCSMNECPGFDRNDCFSLKKSFREKYIDWSEVEERMNSSGDHSQLASSGNNSQLASSGCLSRLASSGGSSQLASSGDYSYIASSGDCSQIASLGYYSRLASAGDHAYINSEGNYSVICCAGNYARVKAKKGSWITLSEWEYKEGKEIPKCVKTEYIDGERIKEDTFYRLKNGEFVEAY